MKKRDLKAQDKQSAFRSCAPPKSAPVSPQSQRACEYKPYKIQPVNKEAYVLDSEFGSEP